MIRVTGREYVGRHYKVITKAISTWKKLQYLGSANPVSSFRGANSSARGASFSALSTSKHE